MGRKHYRKPNWKPKQNHQYQVKKYTIYHGQNTLYTRGYCHFCLADTSACSHCAYYSGPTKICPNCRRQTNLCDYCIRGFKIIDRRIRLIGLTTAEVAHWNQEFIIAGNTSARRLRNYYHQLEYLEYLEERRQG